MAKIIVLIVKIEVEKYSYEYMYIHTQHLNKADPQGRLLGRTGLFMGDLSASKHRSSHCQVKKFIW